MATKEKDVLIEILQGIQAVLAKAIEHLIKGKAQKGEHNDTEPQPAQAATDVQEENTKLKEENAKLHQKISELEEEREQVAARARQTIETCERERDDARNALQAESKKLQATAQQLPTEHLRFVRGDKEVLRLFFPEGLPEDDALAMLGMVAVLAQKSSLERLFDCLSERCKSAQRAVGAPELALLRAALGWFNTQWPEDKRYRLLEVQPGDAFDFNCHTRIGAQAGEHVKAMLLPGLANGFGEVLKKVQIQTQPRV